MDGAKVIPILIILGCGAWIAFDKYQKQEQGRVAGASAPIVGENCDQLRQGLHRIGGEAPTKDQRVQQACRLHVCDMSFMHGRELAFPTESVKLERDRENATLKGDFSATDTAGASNYSFVCVVRVADMDRTGPLPVASASVIQK